MKKRCMLRFSYSAFYLFLFLILFILQLFADMSGNIYTAGGCMRQGMCHTAAVTDDVESFVAAFQIFIQFHFHIVEFYLNAVQQSIIICSTRSNFIQCIDHFDNAIQNTFRKYQT